MKIKLKLWEYLVVTDPDIDKINDLGSNGWELVSVVHFPSISYISTINYYFKRQLR